ncbi:MAG: hypothetical protein IJD64_05370, partial [Clostridia bacterium]|nr:hypothetical protein [Clostridia bacterium]
MEQYREEYGRRKKMMALILKITVIILAAALLTTGVILGVMLATDGFASADDSESDGDGGIPSITGPEDGYVIVYIGDKPSYKSFVKTTGKGELKIDSRVNLDKVGTYTVRYTFGELEYVLTVYVRQRTFTDADRTKLYENIEKIAQEKGMTSGTKTEQVQKVYAFVNKHIHWGTDRSNIADTHGTAFSRDTWQTDWEEEAALSLASGEGDCYSYYSLSKAFFEVLGIENLGIQRSEKSSIEGTHFWNMVNVGSSGVDWYFYDATVLAGRFPDGSS